MDGFYRNFLMKSERRCPQIGHLAARVCVCGRHIIPSREGNKRGSTQETSQSAAGDRPAAPGSVWRRPSPYCPPGRRRTESLLGFPTAGRKDNLKQPHFVKTPIHPLIHLQELLLGSGSPLRTPLSSRDRSVIARAAP